MNETNARLSLGIVLPSAALALILVPYLAFRSELPDRVASHFDGSGAPDGSMTHGTFLVTTLILAGLGVAGCVWLAASRSPLPTAIAPTVGFLGGFLAGLGSGIATATIISQRGIEDWTDASGPWTLIALPMILGVGGGVLAAWFAASLPSRSATHDPFDRPTMELAADQHAVWTETLHSKWLMRFGIIAIVAGVVVAIGSFWWLAFPAVVIGTAMVSLATLRVRADADGLHIRYGPLPWPRTNISIDRIEHATVIDVRPKQWGGWGYRGSLTLMRRAAVVLRAGPGIRLDLRGDKVFVVTVDHPEQPVALLNGEISRATASLIAETS